MDRYQKLVHTNIYQKNMPLPRRREKNSKSTPTYNIAISYDQFMNCMNRKNFQKLPYPIHFTIYDETIVNTRDECMLRYQFLKFLNQIPNAEFDFHLSDSSLPAYISFMNSMNWRHEEKTTFKVSVDRNPASYKRIPLEKAKGTLILQEEELLCYPDQTLRLLPGKVDGEVLSDTHRLKRFIADFRNRLDARYYSSLLTDFDKAYITYHYLFDKPNAQNIAFAPMTIEYADEQTYYDKKGVQRLKASETRWESKPMGTLEHRKGVCTGQSRLLNCVLSSPEIGIPTESISGVIPTGENHRWSHILINGQTFQCCTTMKGLFKNLDAEGYKQTDNLCFTNLYPHAYLPEDAMQKLQSRVKSLKR